jgi:ribosomal protein S18 acetylase RimI-like enzyme
VKVVSTFDSATARRWSIEMFGEGNPFPFFIAPHRFGAAERTKDSLAITLTGSHCFGMGMGPQPPLNPMWTRCSIDRSPFAQRLGALVADDSWDFYSVDTATLSDGPEVRVVRDDAAVTEFLRRHAPDSSVWPGNKEVVAWCVCSDDGEWAAVGALVRWESAQHVLASVATNAQMRGRGFAQRLVRGVLGLARERGIDWVGLGVSHANIPAQRVYGNVGFELRANFTNYVEA